MITKPESFLLLRRDPGGCLIACVYLEKQQTSCYLGLLSVATTQQTQGLGRALVNEAEQFARENLQCQIMRMWVIHQRAELTAYYQRRGYHLTGETHAFAGDQIVGRALRDDLYFDVLEKELI
jgi:predicted N-acetyltransferase YhbS